jgi:hypothetical protein
MLAVLDYRTSSHFRKRVIIFLGKPMSFLFFVGFFWGVSFELHVQFFSYLAAVTIAGDRASNLNFCLALKLLAVRVLLRVISTATRNLRF